MSSSGRAIGSLAGAALGQVLKPDMDVKSQASLPVPVVGSVLGGVAGKTEIL